MAIAKFGAIITDSRGSIGGTTIKWSRFGHVLLNKPQPVHSATYAQTIARNAFTTYSKQWWQELTSSQRDDWRTLAAANPRPNRWGTDYPLTGLALFIAINRALVQNRNSSTLDAPADQAITGLSTLTLTATAPSTASLAFTPSPAPTDHQLVIAASTRTSPGISNFSKTYRFLLATAAATTSPINIASTLTALLGDLVAGRQYAVSARFFNSSNGAYTSPVETSVLAS